MLGTEEVLQVVSAVRQALIRGSVLQDPEGRASKGAQSLREIRCAPQVLEGWRMGRSPEGPLDDQRAWVG